MTLSDQKKLSVILAKIENLEQQTRDDELRARLGTAKTELIRAWNKA